MYFDGFDRPYHYVIEDEDGNGEETTIHAYDVSTVEIHETHDRHGHLETETSADGGPHLTVHTDDAGHIHVIRLDRSRFDG